MKYSLFPFIFLLLFSTICRSQIRNFSHRPSVDWNQKDTLDLFNISKPSRGSKPRSGIQLSSAFNEIGLSFYSLAIAKAYKSWTWSACLDGFGSKLWNQRVLALRAARHNSHSGVGLSLEYYTNSSERAVYRRSVNTSLDGFYRFNEKLCLDLSIENLFPERVVGAASRPMIIESGLIYKVNHGLILYAYFFKTVHQKWLLDYRISAYINKLQLDIGFTPSINRLQMAIQIISNKTQWLFSLSLQPAFGWKQELSAIYFYS